MCAKAPGNQEDQWNDHEDHPEKGEFEVFDHFEDGTNIFDDADGIGEVFKASAESKQVYEGS